MAVPKVGVLRFGAAEAGGEATSEGIKQLRGSSMYFWPECLSGTGIALKSVQEERGDSVPRPDGLRGQGRHRRVVWTRMVQRA